MTCLLCDRPVEDRGRCADHLAVLQRIERRIAAIPPQELAAEREAERRFEEKS